MGYDTSQDRIAIDKIWVKVPKDGAFQKKVVLSCNSVYRDDDEFVLHYNLTDWLRENMQYHWNVVERNDYILFLFDDEGDAALFKLTYS